MGLTVTRDDPSRRLTLTGSDPVTLEDSLAFMEAQVKDGTWSYAVLYDGRSQTGVLNSAEMQHLESHSLRLARIHGRPGPVAIVRGDDAGFLIGRRFEIVSDGVRTVAVFRDLAMATRWLEMQQEVDR
jgi:hypothetical protein